METILLAVTAVSLLVAFVMSTAAWRMSREERARSAARVAALAAQSSLDAPEPVAAMPAAVPPTVLAPAPPPVVDELPLRTAFRAAPEAPRAPEAARVPELTYAAASEAALPSGFLGSAGDRDQSAGAQRGLMAAAAVLFVVLGSGAYLLISDNGSSGRTASAPAETNAPLELISLRHERVGSKLSLSGLVKNPSAGAPVEGLFAVVFLFDAQGGFISSARAGVDFKRLAASDESPFVVSMDAPSQVARYRVSFRTDAGVVAHVDRRSEQPVATAIVR
jgi:hypothetical protein